MFFNESGEGWSASNIGCYHYSASQLKRQDKTWRLLRQNAKEAQHLSFKPHQAPCWVPDWWRKGIEQGSQRLVLSLKSASYRLCEPREIACLLWASVFSAVKWGHSYVPISEGHHEGVIMVSISTLWPMQSHTNIIISICGNALRRGEECISNMQRRNI